KVGMILDGVVKKIVEFGIFISTKYTDGLLHRCMISASRPNKEAMSLMFKIGETIPVYVYDIYGDSIEFSFIHLVRTEYKEFFLDTIILEDSKIIYEDIDDQNGAIEYELEETNKFEIEKGNIFEQYSITEQSIQEKIKNLKFAKVLFSNSKYS